MARGFGSGFSSSYKVERQRVLVTAAVFLAIIFAGGTVLFLFGGEKEKKQVKNSVVKVAEDVKMVDVLVPVKEIKAGTALTPNLFRIEKRPLVATSGRIVRSFEEIKGYYARSLIVPNQPLHRDYITSVRPTNVITASIPEGYRAVTIRVDARSSVEGFVRPGAKVDVVWTSRIRGKPGISVIVQNAKVLSAARSTEASLKPGQPIPSTVTLLVTAKDAAKIELATQTGKLSLQLRGDADPGRGSDVGTVTIDDLYGGGTQNRRRQNADGVVEIDGKKWLLVNGKLVPEGGEM